MNNNIAAKGYLVSITMGIVLIVSALIIEIPGGALTTYASLNGLPASEYYNFDDKYSTIDEYVGGDAYNYIIGASLVAGKMAGLIAAKAIFAVGGVICLCMGISTIPAKNEELSDSTTQPLVTVPQGSVTPLIVQDDTEPDNTTKE